MPPLLAAAAGAKIAPQLIAGGVKILGSLLPSLIGGKQKRMGRDLLAQNQYPAQAIPQELLDNQQMARQMSDVGLPSEQYGQGLKQIERQRVAAMRGATDRRGGLGMINPIQTAANDALGTLTVADANARLQNQQREMQVNQTVAGAKDRAFDWNQKQRYLQDREYGMGLLGAGNVNQMTGLDKAIGGAAELASNIGFGRLKKQGLNAARLAGNFIGQSIRG